MFVQNKLYMKQELLFLRDYVGFFSSSFLRSRVALPFSVICCIVFVVCYIWRVFCFRSVSYSQCCSCLRIVHSWLPHFSYFYLDMQEIKVAYAVNIFFLHYKISLIYFPTSKQWWIWHFASLVFDFTMSIYVPKPILLTIVKAETLTVVFNSIRSIYVFGTLKLI